MTPAHCVAPSPIGDLTIVSTDGVLSGLYLPGHSHPPRATDLGEPTEYGFEAVTAQLDEYFAGERTQFSVPFTLRGTAFQRTVWALLCAIPYGQTRSYAELAEELGKPAAIRALAAANGRNPISIIVPCHRVIGSDGALVGYAGGLARKRSLLELEGAIPPADTLF